MNTQCYTQLLFCIPIGMRRSVENAVSPLFLHPVKDASLSGCRSGVVNPFSTERCIPNGIQICCDTGEILSIHDK
jgi:hypothetical protein